MKPLISVIIPCYNQSHFLPECLNSLLMQTFEYWEALVINDGSTDETAQVAFSYSRKDSRIRCYEKKNGGLSSARNHGIQHAKGDRFLFLDSDDYLYPNCLEVIYKEVSLSTDNCFIQYGYSYITENGKKKLADILPQEKTPLIPGIFQSNLGPCHSICISKSLVGRAGYFDEELKSVEDWDFWIRVVKCGGIQKIVPEVLVYYRYSDNSMSRNPFTMYDSLEKVIRRAPLKDERIKEGGVLNYNYDFDVKPVLSFALIRSLGVGIMQGRIDDSVAYFQNKSVYDLLEYKPAHMEVMCSYLSFRYFTSKVEIHKILSTYPALYRIFFKKAGFSESFIQKALYHIFKRHKQLYRINNYGFAGRILNYCERFINSHFA